LGVGFRVDGVGCRVESGGCEVKGVRYRVRGFHRAQAAAAFLCSLEADAGNALDLRLRVYHGVVTCSVAGFIRAKALGLAEVDASDKLAHHHDVGALHHLALEGGGVDELRQDVGRA
jgi:hypothetical protein